MTDDINPYRSPPESESLPINSIDDGKSEILHGRLLTLATFTEAIDAHLFRNELALHGINSAVTNENSTAIFGATVAGQSAAFTVDVMIMETDAERGLEVKKQWNASPDEKNANKTEIPEWTCSCGETVDAGFAVCWSCEKQFGVDD